MENTQKKRKQLVWVIAIILASVSSYVLWNKPTTPPRLPLKDINSNESLNIELINQLGGAVSSGQIKPLVVNDNLVYVGIGPRLAILDISNPSNIYLVGQSDIIPDLIGEIVLVGNYIYIAPGGYGDDIGANQKLHIVDVSNPLQPQYVGAYSPKDRYVSSVYIYDEFLYITAKDANSNFDSGDKELYILDISNPVQPKEIGHYAFNEGISDLAMSGSYVYVGTYKPGLRILDISDLENPKEIDFPGSPKSGSSLFVNGNYLYVSGSTEEITFAFLIFDISNPRELKNRVTIARDGDAAQLISVFQNTAYFWGLGDRNPISFVDVSDPQKPRDIGSQIFIGWDVSVQKDMVFVMNDNKLILYDVSDPLKPVKLGYFTTLTSDQYLPELYFSETKAVMPVYTDMNILDFSDPTLPVVLNLYSFEDVYPSVDGLYKDFVYLHTRDEYQALDISNPIDPVIMWRYDIFDANGKPILHAFTENYACVFNRSEGFYVYDISDPANPAPVYYQINSEEFDSLDDCALVENYLYVLNGRDVYIYDFTDLSAITKKGVFQFPSDQPGYRKITIIDDLAFFSTYYYSDTGDTNLTLLDVSNPEDPTLITSYSWGKYSAIEGFSKDSIFINEYDGLHVVDFSDPMKPYEVGYYGVDQGYGTGPDSLVLTRDNYIYLVNYTNGLYVFRYLQPAK